MTSVVRPDLELFEKTSLKPVCAAPGPFVTVYLPARQPGASHLPVTPRLARIVRSAAAELARRRYADPLPQLLAPLEELVRDPALLAGSSASVVFCAPGIFRQLRVPEPVEERLVVATHPYITPILPHIAPDEFYVLSVNTKLLRLGRWRAGDIGEVGLPRSIPPSLEEAGGFDQPDHDLENRSSGGAANGQTAKVRFGMSPDREKFDHYVHDYLRLVDRELARILGGAPLVLVGVAEELAAYRQAGEYPRMLEARHTSAAHLTWQEIGKLALESVLKARRAEAGALWMELREDNRRNHVASGIRQVLEAAHQGRIHRLLLVEGSEVQGLPGPLFSIAETKLEGAQDLLNAAAVETIRHGGDVLTLDLPQMGDLAPAAALLRY